MGDSWSRGRKKKASSYLPDKPIPDCKKKKKKGTRLAVPLYCRGEGELGRAAGCSSNTMPKKKTPVGFGGEKGNDKKHP